METIILILITIGVVSLILMAITNIIVNIKIEKKYDAIIKLQENIIENNKDITDKFEAFKKIFNKNITDIAKTFNFYDKRLITLEERHYKRKKRLIKKLILIIPIMFNKTFPVKEEML